MITKELLRSREFKWFNIFLRDLFLVLAVAGMHYLTNFNSKSIFMITGMLVVWITWQFSDFLTYLKYKRGLN